MCVFNSSTVNVAPGSRHVAQTEADGFNGETWERTPEGRGSVGRSEALAAKLAAELNCPNGKEKLKKKTGLPVRLRA